MMSVLLFMLSATEQNVCIDQLSLKKRCYLAAFATLLLSSLQCALIRVCSKMYNKAHHSLRWFAGRQPASRLRRPVCFAFKCSGVMEIYKLQSFDYGHIF